MGRDVPVVVGTVGVVAEGGKGPQSSASTAGTGDEADIWMRARRVKARPRRRARSEGMLRSVAFEVVWREITSVIEFLTVIDEKLRERRWMELLKGILRRN